MWIIFLFLFQTLLSFYYYNSFMIMLTRSSVMIFYPMSYTGINNMDMVEIFSTHKIYLYWVKLYVLLHQQINLQYCWCRECIVGATTIFYSPRNGTKNIIAAYKNIFVSNNMVNKFIDVTIQKVKLNMNLFSLQKYSVPYPYCQYRFVLSFFLV